MNTELADLALEVEAALTLDDDLAGRAMDALVQATGDSTITPADLDSVDRILTLILDRWTGWSVSTHGNARLPNGHWGSTLRRGSTRDDDEVIGVGRGTTLAHSLVAALLKLVAMGK